MLIQLNVKKKKIRNQDYRELLMMKIHQKYFLIQIQLKLNKFIKLIKNPLLGQNYYLNIMYLPQVHLIVDVMFGRYKITQEQVL